MKKIYCFLILNLESRGEWRRWENSLQAAINLPSALSAANPAGVLIKMSDNYILTAKWKGKREGRDLNEGGRGGNNHQWVMNF